MLKCQYPFLLNTHTSSFPDVWFSLNGTTYQNNSLVTLEDIGKEDDALFCETNQMACCKSSDTGNTQPVLGNWFFPNGARVHSRGNQSDFYRTRGEMVVQLHHRRGGVEGIYRCDIPDSMNVSQSIYIGVYTANTGEWHCLYTPVLFNTSHTAVLMNGNTEMLNVSLPRKSQEMAKCSSSWDELDQTPLISQLVY